jgi:two-component system, cell cycle response regulator
MDAQQHAMIRKINRRLVAFVEAGTARAIDGSELDGPLAALVETVNRLVTCANNGDRTLSEKDFFEAGVSEFLRAGRYGRQLSVLALGIDRYDATVAEHGDAVAADARATAARVLDAVLRANDLFGQRSETGFAVILPETEGEHAAEVGERVRAAFEAEDVFTGDQLIIFTVSVGAVGVLETDEGFEATYRRATEAMHAASTAGGNRVSAP